MSEINRNVIKQKYSDIIRLLNTIEEALTYIDEEQDQVVFGELSFLFLDINDAVNVVNQRLFQNAEINIYGLSKLLSTALTHKDKYQIVFSCKEWIKFINDVIEKRSCCSNNLDEQFMALMDMIAYVNADVLIDQAKKRLHMNSSDTIKIYNGYYQKYSYFWGMLDTDNNNYEVIINRVNALIEHREDFIWLYEKLGDYRSKLVLCNMLSNWISYDVNFIIQMKENNFKDYYDLDLLKCDENEVIVDLGTYDGDSVIDYIETYGVYKRIYCYEISQVNIDKAQANLSSYDNIELIKKGAGEKNDVMYIKEDTDSSSCTIDRSGDEEVQIVAIDDDIREKVTLIKMDIEGSEQSALKGCRKHIVEEKPKLLICVYHNNEDIWKIPRMIMEMRDDYKLYLRSNGQQWGPAEIVLFAL